MTLRGLSIALLLCLCADAAWRLGQSDVADVEPRFDLPRALHARVSPDTLPSNVDTPSVQCADPVVWQQGRLPMPPATPAAHASTLVALDARHAMAASKSVVAFWFAGTRESASDVGIVASTYDKQRQQWDAPQWVVTREKLQTQLGVAVRRIGNPVAWRDADGRLHLYVVATGLGGWAASRVVHLVEAPHTQTSPIGLMRLQFVAERILPLMPLATWFNTSTLVRAQPQALQDGGAIVPMYFELGTKYALAVRVGPQGQLRDVRRMSRRHDVLQPTLVASSETQAVAFMRDNSDSQRVTWTQTEDGGQHWQDQADAQAGNPDSSLAALRLPSGEWLIAHNLVPQRRAALWLSRVRDPQQTWQSSVLVQGEAGSEYSYPSMLWLDVAPTDLRHVVLSAATTHEVWVSYTDQRQAIAFARLVLTCQPIRSDKGRQP